VWDVEYYIAKIVTCQNRAIEALIIYKDTKSILRKLKISVIGKSGHAARIISLLHDIPDVHIQYVYYHKKTTDGSMPFTSNINDLMSSDGIIIASPTPTHAEYIDMLEGYNGYLLVEKPIVSTKEQTEQLWKIPLERKSRIKVNYNFLYSSVTRYIKEILSANQIGLPVSFDVHTCQGLAHNEKYKNSWRSNISESFGVMELVGVHYINLAISLFGKIDHSKIDCLWKTDYKAGPPDTVFLRLKMSSDICVNLFHSYAGPYFTHMVFMGTDGYWEYDGNEARLHYPRDIFDNSGRFTTPPLVKQEKLEYPHVFKESLLNSVNAFLDVVRSSGKFDSIDFESALASMEPVFKARNQYSATN